MNVYKINTDGSVRVSQKRSGIGGVIKLDGKIVHKFSKEIKYLSGIGTVEYEAIIHALEWSVNAGITCVSLFVDSQFVINQINGVFTVRSPEIKERYAKVMSLLSNMTYWEATHIDREYNKEADKLAGMATGRDEKQRRRVNNKLLRKEYDKRMETKNAKLPQKH